MGRRDIRALALALLASLPSLRPEVQRSVACSRDASVPIDNQVRRDRRDTMWVASFAAFAASVVLNHFLPVSGFGLSRIVVIWGVGSVLLYFILRPWASSVAKWSSRRSDGTKAPPSS